MPILKQSSSNSKKRTRIDREMISAPLGDFRHTMHVGRGGDVFGDTSFLSNHGPAPAPATVVEAPVFKKNGLLKLVGDHDEIKMADSLSQRSQSSGIGSGAGSVSSSPVNNLPSKDDSLWNNSSSGDRSEVDWMSPGCGMKHAESILSFHLDLGPSILDDVLGVMDRDGPPCDLNSPDNQFDYKFSTLNSSGNDKITQSTTITESQGNHYSLSSTLPVTNPGLDYNSTISNNVGGNRSAYEGDSEEEKRSVYEGVADCPSQQENGFHVRRHVELDDEDDDDDDEEEVSQGYAFEEDLDDEIGV